jgi:hypothetical protein
MNKASINNLNKTSANKANIKLPNSNLTTKEHSETPSSNALHAASLTLSVKFRK